MTEVHRTKVTDRGGITIPADIRSRFDIEPGDEIKWRVLDDGSIEVEVVNQRYGAFEGDDVKADLRLDEEDSLDAIGDL